MQPHHANSVFASLYAVQIANDCRNIVFVTSSLRRAQAITRPIAPLSVTANAAFFPFDDAA